MGRHTRSKRNRLSRGVEVRRRRRMVGWGTSAGAVMAFGLGPLGAAPSAHADIEDVIIDPIISAISGFDPSLGADLSTVMGDFVSSGWLDSLGPDFSGVDSALGAASSGASLVPDTGSALSSAAVSGADASGNLAQTWEQDWITSQFGTEVDDAINSYVDKVDPSLVGDSCGLICNGADGTSGGTLADGGWPGRWGVGR